MGDRGCRRAVAPRMRGLVVGVPVLVAFGVLGVWALAGGSEPRSSEAVGSIRPTTSATGPVDVAAEAADTTTPDEEAAILAAVDGYWESYFAANDPPNPDHPDLARYRTGQALADAVQNTTDRAALGQAIRFPENSAWVRLSNLAAYEDLEAVVTDCVVDDSQLIDSFTGEILASSVETTLFELGLIKESDGWKVQTILIDRQWEGEEARCGQ